MRFAAMELWGSLMREGVAAGRVGGQRRRGRGAHWVRALPTGLFASSNGASCGRRGRSRGLRPCGRSERSLAVRRSPRPTIASPRAARLAGHHSYSRVSCGTCRRGRAGSLLAAQLAEQRNAAKGTPCRPAYTGGTIGAGDSGKPNGGGSGLVVRLVFKAAPTPVLDDTRRYATVERSTIPAPFRLSLYRLVPSRVIPPGVQPGYRAVAAPRPRLRTAVLLGRASLRPARTRTGLAVQPMRGTPAPASLSVGLYPQGTPGAPPGGWHAPTRLQCRGPAAACCKYIAWSL